jgi:DNA-binding MarR family transcriptional regulator
MARTPNKRAAPRLTDEDYAALGAFRHALRKFMAFSEAGARSHGLTSQQHQALLAIRTHPGPEPMSIGELAECLLIKNHSAVGLVGRLQDRGLVARRVSAGDRRRVLLEITAEAERMLASISRDNLAELKSSAETFRILLAALRDIDERNAG